MNVTFDSAAVKRSAPFAFGLDASDWDRAAEDAMYADAVERGVVMECGPLPVPAVEPEPSDAGRYEAPTAAARAWWTAETLGKATDGFMIEGEPVKATRRSRPARRPARLSPAAEAARKRAEDELRWADYLEREARHHERRRMEAAGGF